ncbi:LacI family DNA-binding transcriptional regulator [Paenibacillus daejeonensis]|uniref:LacI family DNA-binding transcriptional regulator n=1 Tax=Paenibacillus daejeonensis TaxID=135193 RepID=UPI0003726919|nr:LacI family DNA-binding transcriptional regulator [Paenibacillus daejeonensis]
MNKKSVTLELIAERMGLSVQTVSKALRGKPGMSEETRQAVAVMARQLGYRTKGQRHSMSVEQLPLIPGANRRFSFVMNGDQSFSGLNQLILQGLQERLSEFGHTVGITVTPPRFADNKSFEDWAEQQNLAYMDGIFLSPSLTPDLEEKLLALSMPRILINFPPHAAEVDSIIWDVATAIHQSVHQLLMQGHRRILYIGKRITHRGFTIRWQAFQAAMEHAGLAAEEHAHMVDEVMDRSVWSAELGRKLQAMQATAILSGLDYDLPWVYYACSSAGIRIPEDCSLISLQNAENQTMPGISRPRLLVSEAGERAAERMLWRLANPTLPYEQIRLQGSFFTGETIRSYTQEGLEPR